MNNFSFNDRFELFKKDLISKVTYEYGYYFDPLLEAIDTTRYQHWLWYFIQPYTNGNGSQISAGIFLIKNRDLPNEIVDFIEVILILHFGPAERFPLLRKNYREGL